jgi:predicted metal-dependent hydrolase
MFQKPDFSTIHPALVPVSSARARRLTLRPDPGQRCVKLVMPKRASRRKAFNFANAHKDWIARQLANMPAPVPFEDGAIIPILGVEKRLTIFYDDTLNSTSITLKDNEIRVSTNRDDITSRLTRYLKNHTRQYIRELASAKAAQIDKDIKRISLRDPKSRWGSCSSDGNLSFSWRLIFAPLEAFDYVIAHEVAHLQHLNHSKAFWQTCRALSRDFETGHNWMRRHGASLLAYGQTA